MNNKKCTCIDPKIVQSIPSGYRGIVTCAKCGGEFEYPRKEAKYQGNDPVEKYLFEISKNSSELTFETAVLKMLLRLEKAIRDKR